MKFIIPAAIKRSIFCRFMATAIAIVTMGMGLSSAQAVNPTVTINATDASAAEAGNDPGTFRITRVGDTTDALNVNYTIATGVGQATNGVDYTPMLSGAAVIPAGQAFVDITITPVDDTLLEGDETVTLNLAASADYDLGATVTATVTIADDEVAIDLSKYKRIHRYPLPEPTRTAAPANSLLCQEASSVTYNWDTDTLFVVGDGGTSVVQVSKTGVLINSMTLAPGSSPQGTEFYDTEGITYVGNNQFVFTEERYRQLNLFTYVPGGVLQRSATRTVKLGTTIGNIGLEGVTYDPQTGVFNPSTQIGGFICVKEKQPESIFQTGVDFTALTATNGSPTATASTDLFDPSLVGTADFSDIFAMSNLPALTGKATSSHLLIISQESGQIVHVDRMGNVLSRLTITADPGDALSIPDQTHEGVTMDRNGFIYTVCEDGGGDINHPELWVYAPSNAQNLPPTAVALTNPVSSIPENTSTAGGVKVADIVVTDDGLGVNNLTVSGADAASFQVTGTGLFLKSGTVLSSTSKPTYNVTVNVDDPSVGTTPDASTNFTLTITASTGGTAQLIISEVAPWSSGNSTLGADWFEVTNVGSAAQDITGWKMDDNSYSAGSAVALTGITSIAPGESVIFIETTSGDLATLAAKFKTIWFGNNPPPNLQIGGYGGSGVGLSTGGDAVTLFDAANTIRAQVTFPTSPSASPFGTFDNAAGINGTTNVPANISTLSAAGVNGAFAVNDSGATLVGSPGTIGVSLTPVVTIAATSPNAAEAGNVPGTFRISRTGSTISPQTVSYTIATGAGQATNGVDYTPTLTGTATIPSGQSFVDITITPVDDSLVEGPETVTLTVGDTGNYDVGSPATATVTIADDVANQPTNTLIISEVAPWSSGNSTLGADWFEVTNIGTTAQDITGWKMDDNSYSATSAVALTGITSIAPGESVIFIETTGSDLATLAAKFKTIWFGGNPPPNLQIGGYGGSGVGLGTGGDAVTLFDSTNTIRAQVTFPASPSTSPYATFDNKAGINGTTTTPANISTLSVAGVNGAFTVTDGTSQLIGSPGATSVAGSIIISEVAPWSSGNSPIGVDWFEVTNIGTIPVSTVGWRMDDNSNSFAASVPMSGVTSIAPGESVIFMETADLATSSAAFKSLWFGANPPANLQFGSYSGSGVGLSTGGDAVNLFDAAGNVITGVTFGAAPATAPFATFENKARLGSTVLPGPSFSTLSTAGFNGAFTAVGDVSEVASPGTLPSGLIAGSGTLDLLAAIGAPAGSTFSGPGVSGTTFDPTGLTPGVKTITYTYAGPSGPLSTTFSITVPQPVPVMPGWAWAMVPTLLCFVAFGALRKQSLAS